MIYSNQKEKFLKHSDINIEEGIFVGQQIQGQMENKNIEPKLNTHEIFAWKYFRRNLERKTAMFLL